MKVGYASKKYYRDPKKLFGRGKEGRKEGRKEAESGISGHWTLVESGSPTISTNLLDLTYIRSQQACCAFYVYIYKCMYTLSTI